MLQVQRKYWTFGGAAALTQHKLGHYLHYLSQKMDNNICRCYYKITRKKLVPDSDFNERPLAWQTIAGTEAIGGLESVTSRHIFHWNEAAAW